MGASGSRKIYRRDEFFALTDAQQNGVVNSSRSYANARATRLSFLVPPALPDDWERRPNFEKFGLHILYEMYIRAMLKTGTPTVRDEVLRRLCPLILFVIII